MLPTHALCLEKPMSISIFLESLLRSMVEELPAESRLSLGKGGGSFVNSSIMTRQGKYFLLLNDADYLQKPLHT